MNVELLLPAGSLEKMRVAYDFGADAVYAGQPRYSLRARNNEFSVQALEQGIKEAHARGKQFYVTTNILPHNNKIKSFLSNMEPVIAMKPDALIMADPGLIMMIRDKWAHMPIHLSVQANTVNYMAVKFWQRLGISRIILSRELSLSEIEQIRQECPDMELEVFVHGALCIAYSGRCLLSGYFNHRDPNQGTCTNACRWDYKMNDTQLDDAGDVRVQPQRIQFDMQNAWEEENQSFSSTQIERHPLANKVYLIEEATRPSELMPIMEDEHGTYIMNSKDLRAIKHVEKLIKIGVNSLKIEGRTKSLYYVARTAQTYRRAIDDALAGRAFNPELMLELEGLANRGYTDGFLDRHQAHDTQNYHTGHSVATHSQYVGNVVAVDAQGLATVDVKNKFAVGDTLEVIHPSGNITIKLENMLRDGQAIAQASGSGYEVKIPNLKGKDGALLARIF